MVPPLTYRRAVTPGPVVAVVDPAPEPRPSPGPAPIAVERGGRGPVQVTLRCPAGPGPATWAVRYGGVDVGTGLLGGGPVHTVDVPGIEDWMQDQALTVLVLAAGEPLAVTASCLRPAGPRPTRAESIARRRWPRLRSNSRLPDRRPQLAAGRHDAVIWRRDPADESGRRRWRERRRTVVVYRDVRDLVAIRSRSLVGRGAPTPVGDGAPSAEVGI